MISIGRRIFSNFFTTRHMCVVIHAEIGKNLRVWHVQAFKMSYKYETLNKLDQHVNEIMPTAGKKFQNF